MLYRSVYLYFQSHVIFLSNIENSYKMELPFSTHPFSYPSPLIHIKSHETLSHTHTHTLPSNYTRTLQKPPKAEIIEFIIPFYFQVMRLIYTRSNPPPSHNTRISIAWLGKLALAEDVFPPFLFSSLFFPLSLSTGRSPVTINSTWLAKKQLRTTF